MLVPTWEDYLNTPEIKKGNDYIGHQFPVAYFYLTCIFERFEELMDLKIRVINLLLHLYEVIIPIYFYNNNNNWDTMTNIMVVNTNEPVLWLIKRIIALLGPEPVYYLDIDIVYGKHSHDDKKWPHVDDEATEILSLTWKNSREYEPMYTPFIDLYSPIRQYSPYIFVSYYVGS